MHILQQVKRCILTAAVAVSVLAAAGCAVGVKQETQGITPKFSETNAVLIERNIGDLGLARALSGIVKRDENIIVVSLEDRDITDRPINYLIDDLLIADLTDAGFPVLERDPDVLYHAGFERDDGALESADVIVSYRLLECGIRYDTHDSIVEKEGEGGKTETRLEIALQRESKTRLFLRVVDVRTGEIRLARFLENTSVDVKSFLQSDTQTEGQLWETVDNYLKELDQYEYTFYRQTLPNQKFESPPEGPQSPEEQLVSIIEEPEKAAEDSRSNILTIVFGIAAGALAVTVVALLATM